VPALAIKGPPAALDSAMVGRLFLDVAEPADDRFRQLLDALPVAIYTTDAVGLITFYNRAAVEFAGREPELGKARWCVTWRLYWPDGTPMRHDECPMALALKEGRAIRGVEAIMERPDGTRVCFQPYPTPLYDPSGELVGGVNMLVDITERKQAEHALQRLNVALEQRAEERSTQLRATEQRFRLLVEGVVDYAIFMLDPNGFVTNWNSGAARIKGYTAEEIIGRHFSQFYTEEDRQNGLPKKVLETARRYGRFEAEGWRVRKDGTKFWASVVIDAIRDDAGELIGFAKVTRDLTERRAAEQQLRQAQKMEAVGQLTGGVAHDFNNLLTAIIGNLEMLDGLLPAGNPCRRYAEGALRAAARGSELTQQLLSFSRKEEIQPQIASVNELLRETQMLCQRTVGEGIYVELNLQEDDLWPSCIDPAQFAAAILNLAANARDAMNRAGRLTLRTENMTTGGAYPADLPAGDYVVLSVSDTGGGMSADVLERAFEPFFTTKDIGQGTGLGLSQVYGFAKQSGGAARIESKVGEGTTVRIYLPRASGKPPAKVDQKESVAKGLGAATILVVEDDIDVREMIVGLLSDLGYETLVATNAAEALEILKQESSVDLLFTDIVMPGGTSGIELARQASRMRPGLKVLLSSGYAREEAQARRMRVEFPFIGKPYRPSTLGKKLKEVLSGRFLRLKA
jgi:PAS domain S-box-containing protein